MTSAPRQKLGYRPELDGVRALAVLFILLYHLTLNLLPGLRHVARGGFLSVDLFFVLSGMLITEILIADADRLGRVDLIGFFRRRGRRLLPALFTFIALTLAWYEVAHGLGKVQAKGLERVLTYTVLSKPDVPAFPFGLGQVWTLVVEWEFYLLWAIALALLLALRIPRQVIGGLALAGVAVCSLGRIWLWHHNQDFVLNYHLGMLRFQDMLTGCAVALLPMSRRIPNVVRTAGVVFLVVATTRAEYQAAWVYQWGLLLTALSTGVMIAPRNQPWWFDRFLASRPIVWVGVISYSLYLWSVFTLSEVGGHTKSWPLAPRVIVILVIAFGLASLSYYQVEKRFRARSRRAEPGGAMLGEPDADATAAP
jgi:peptidoglycan/LPS O-acetylase OafA/YrhL